MTTAGCTFFLSSGVPFRLWLSPCHLYTNSRKSVQLSLDLLHRGDMQSLGLYVVSMVDHSSCLKIQRNLEFPTDDPPHPHFNILNSGKGQKGPCLFLSAVPSHSLYPEESFVKSKSGHSSFLLKTF